ncbi:hypothetical protein BDF19DRAFT_450537 [Syncephalis fuscata]|nr:hypothetical protein BDF19DRAFT_450537 [Syncephalis fuscata]
MASPVGHEGKPTLAVGLAVEETGAAARADATSKQQKRHKNTGTNTEFKRITVRINVTLPPCYVANPLVGVQEQLNRFVLRYMSEVDGVVLAYGPIQFLQRNARIMYDSPFSHFFISTTLLVWRPSIGMILAGTINLQSRDHIGVLLHGTFNASIPSDLIPKDRYRWKDRPKHEIESADDSSTAHGQWISRDNNEPLGGSTGQINFSVADIITANAMLTIVGTLLDRMDEVEADAEANASMLGHTIDNRAMAIASSNEASAVEKKKKKKKKHDKETV